MNTFYNPPSRINVNITNELLYYLYYKHENTVCSKYMQMSSKFKSKDLWNLIKQK